MWITHITIYYKKWVLVIKIKVVLIVDFFKIVFRRKYSESHALYADVINYTVSDVNNVGKRQKEANQANV